MPKREDEYWANTHPPYCTCVDCTRRRLARGGARRRSTNPGCTVTGIIIALVIAIFIATRALCPGEAEKPHNAGSSVSIVKDEERPANPTFQTYHNKQPPYVRTLGGPSIQLVNNPKATDPTWAQLVAFLRSDSTDLKPYSVISFPCGAFAEEVHNNAEASGIKAAWVSVDFTVGEGHALNAFMTTDKGLVFIDCTGKDFLRTLETIKNPSLERSETQAYGHAKSWDKVAYLEIGKELGLISLEVADSPVYSRYEQHKLKRLSFGSKLRDYNQRVEEFNREVQRYNQWVMGRVLYEGTAEAQRAEQWYWSLKAEEARLERIAKELDNEAHSLGAFWEPLGIVSKVEIYW